MVSRSTCRPWTGTPRRRAKRDPAALGGWNISLTASAAILLLDPVNNHYAEASGDRAQFGWPQDEEIERLRMAFLLGTDSNQQFSIARQVQQRMMDLSVTVPLGPYVQPLARRKNVSGNIEAPVPVFWNVDVK